MLDCMLLLTLVVMWLSWWHHAHIVIQSYTYKHAMVLHNGKRTRARNLNRYLHRNPPEADQVSAPEPSGTATGICSGNLRDLTKYLHWNLPEPHQVSQPTWIDTKAIMLDDTLLLTVYDLVLVIMTSCAHCQTIIHIQSYRYKAYTYNHAMMPHTGTWRIPMRSSTNT